MKRSKGPEWFKLRADLLPMFRAASDEAVGRGLKLALEYFTEGSVELEGTQSDVLMVLGALQPSLDEARNAYQEAVENGRAGGQKRWGRS